MKPKNMIQTGYLKTRAKPRQSMGKKRGSQNRAITHPQCQTGRQMWIIGYRTIDTTPKPSLWGKDSRFKSIEIDYRAHVKGSFSLQIGSILWRVTLGILLGELLLMHKIFGFSHYGYGFLMKQSFFRHLKAHLHGKNKRIMLVGQQTTCGKRMTITQTFHMIHNGCTCPCTLQKIGMNRMNITRIIYRVLTGAKTLGEELSSIYRFPAQILGSSHKTVFAFCFYLQYIQQFF